MVDPLQEVQLPTTKASNDRFDHLSTLYGVIVSLDYLERAYIRDSITQEQCVEPLLPCTGRAPSNQIEMCWIDQGGGNGV